MKDKAELIRIVIIVLLLATIVSFFLNGIATITCVLAIAVVVFSYLYQYLKQKEKRNK